MATTTDHPRFDWTNYHYNGGPYSLKLMQDIVPNKSIANPVDRYNDGALELRRLIQESIQNNHRFRAYGSSWSLNNIAHQQDRMLYNSRLNLVIDVTAEQLHTTTGYDHRNLFLIECGAVVKQIHNALRQRGKSLKTCGASNGQTIAGAIATGVHGSAIDVGSIQDAVVGLNLIIGPTANDRVYIERSSQPALNDTFAASIQSRVIRNDDLFNAALVGLGAFGVIHGVVIEAEDIYLLQRYVRKINRTDALELARTLDFKNSPFKIPQETAADGTGARPYHYKLYINPYRPQDDFVTEIIYKKNYVANYPNPIPEIQSSLYKDLPSFIAWLAAKFKRSIPLLVAGLKGEVFPEVDKDTLGTLGEIFWDTSPQGAAFGSAFAIDIGDSGKALDVLTKVIQDFGPIPGILSMRFVSQSKATLGFTRFPFTCVLEVDGVLWTGNHKIISLEDYLTKCVEALKAAGIPFAQHWGKNAAWGFPGLVDYMYGNADDQWKNMRSALLTKQTADLFSNDFLNTVSLSDYRVNAQPELIATAEIPV